MKIATFLLAALSVFAQAMFAQAQAPATPAPKSATDKAALEAYLRHVELWLPQITVTIDDPKPAPQLPNFSLVGVHLSYNGATKDEFYYVSKDGQKIIKGDVYDINKSPFQSNLDQLKTDEQPSFGSPTAPVTIVEFGDFECPVCKQESEVFRKQLATAYADKVHVYFEDFPLETIHPWARTAALAGRCLYRENSAAFWQFHDWIYENQASVTVENISSKLQDFAKEKGIDGVQLGRCVDTKATEAEVNRSIALGHDLQVSATPTLFINGRKMDGALEYPVLEQLIKFEIEHQAKNPGANEACCVVTIPTVVKK